MHDYSIDKHPKEKIIAVLAFVALLLAPQVNELFLLLDQRLPLNGIPVFSAVSLLTIFGLVYRAFDAYMWRWKWLRRFLLVPDLNGTWACQGNTRLKEGKAADFPWEAVMTVTQSWSRLSVHLRTKTSASRSVAASISRVDGLGYRLLYQYANDPGVTDVELKKHDGTCDLFFPDGLTSGEGSYFTDRHRLTVGEMRLTRTKRT